MGGRRGGHATAIVAAVFAAWPSRMRDVCRPQGPKGCTPCSQHWGDRLCCWLWWVELQVKEVLLIALPEIFRT